MLSRLQTMHSSAHLSQGLIMAHVVAMPFLLIELIPGGQFCVSIFPN